MRCGVRRPQQGVKGKQVQILCDLVTVTGEKTPLRCAQPLKNREGGVFAEPQPGNLPVLGTGAARCPGPRGIGRAERSCTGGFVCVLLFCKSLTGRVRLFLRKAAARSAAVLPRSRGDLPLYRDFVRSRPAGRLPAKPDRRNLICDPHNPSGCWPQCWLRP